MVIKKYTKTELNKLKRNELLSICKRRKITGCSTKKVAQLRTIIYDHQLKSLARRKTTSKKRPVRKPKRKNFAKMKIATLKGLVTRFKLKPKGTRKSDLVLALNDYYSKKSRAKSIKIPTRRKVSPRRKVSRKRKVSRSRSPISKGKCYENLKKCGEKSLCNAKTGRCIKDTPANRKNKNILKIAGATIVGTKAEINSLKKILKGERPETKISKRIVDSIVSLQEPTVEEPVEVFEEEPVIEEEIEETIVEEPDIVQEDFTIEESPADDVEIVTKQIPKKKIQKEKMSLKPPAAVSSAREKLMIDFEKCLSTL